MTLNDLIKTLSGNMEIVITALVYFKESKKYYSFRTIIFHADHEMVENCRKKLDEDTLKLQVKSIDYFDRALWVDVVEYIPDI